MKPLADVTVIELCREAAPLHIRMAMAMAGRLTADQGARVICLTPPGGDPLETVPPFLEGGASAAYAFLTTGKDILRSADEHAFARGVDALIRLRPAAAILAEDDPDRSRIAAAGIAVITLATWPEGSPAAQSGAPANSFGVMAGGGVLDIIGDPAREPLRLGGHQISYAAGLSAFTALTAAVIQHDRDGQALHARVSLLETAIWMNWKVVVAASQPGPHSTRRGDKADFPVVRCKDGWIGFVYSGLQFDRVRAMLGDAAMTDPRSLGPDLRAEALMTAAGPWLAERTRDEVYAAARAHGVPIGPVYTPAELLEDEHYLARDFLVPSAGQNAPRFPGPPMMWNGKRPAPGAGRALSLAEIEEMPA